MASRYLNLSELAHVRWRAEEIIRRRRPRRASRVRRYTQVRPAVTPQPVPDILAPHVPAIPEPRRPIDVTDPAPLYRVLAGLYRLGEAS